MITEDYVSFETAKLLKEKGFDMSCEYLGYNIFDSEHRQDTIENFSRSEAPHLYVPTISQARAMKWLREEKGIAVIPVLSSVLDNEKFLWDVKVVDAKTNDTYSQGWVYEKQEAACERAIKYCLENLI